MKSKQSLYRSLITAWGVVLIGAVPLPGMSPLDLGLNSALCLVSVALMLAYWSESVRDKHQPGAQGSAVLKCLSGGTSAGHFIVRCPHCDWQRWGPDLGTLTDTLLRHARENHGERSDT